jgi:HIV Tat-specific factor 1
MYCQDDPSVILDIKEDIRDECAKLGNVSNVVLYDLEPDGVASVKFTDPDAAQACVKVWSASITSKGSANYYTADAWSVVRRAPVGGIHKDRQREVQEVCGQVQCAGWR